MQLDADDSDEDADVTCTTSQAVPQSYAEAMCQEDLQEWHQAALDDLNAQRQNGTWILVPRPTDRPVIGSKWVFACKYHADGFFDHYKARLVAQGFNQHPGFEYLEVFAPTVRLPTLRIVLVLAAIHDWHLWSVDISHAYLNGEIDCEVYMEQPIGFREGDPKKMVCKLEKALYGTQDGNRWYHKLRTVLGSMGFTPTYSDAAVYIFTCHDLHIILPVFVDNMTFASKSLDVIKQIIEQLFSTYSNANHGGCKDSGWSTGTYIVKIGTGVVSWMSKCQPIIALSTTEVEYIAACEAGKEFVWMRKLLEELGFPMDTHQQPVCYPGGETSRTSRLALVLAQRCGGQGYHFTQLCSHWWDACWSIDQGFALSQSRRSLSDAWTRQNWGE